MPLFAYSSLHFLFFLSDRASPFAMLAYDSRQGILISITFCVRLALIWPQYSWHLITTLSYHVPLAACDFSAWTWVSVRRTSKYGPDSHRIPHIEIVFWVERREQIEQCEHEVGLNLWLVANFKRIFYHQGIHVFYNRQLWCLWSILDDVTVLSV